LSPFIPRSRPLAFRVSLAFPDFCNLLSSLSSLLRCPLLFPHRFRASSPPPIQVPLLSPRFPDLLYLLPWLSFRYDLGPNVLEDFYATASFPSFGVLSLRVSRAKFLKIVSRFPLLEQNLVWRSSRPARIAYSCPLFRHRFKSLGSVLLIPVSFLIVPPTDSHLPPCRLTAKRMCGMPFPVSRSL